MRGDRPFGITILSVYYLAWGLLALLFNLFGTVIGFLTICFSFGTFASSVGGLITAILNILLAGALFSGRNFARGIVMILAVLGIAAGILSGVQGGFGIGLIVNVAINAFVLYYMQQDSVKRFFAAN
ncbi:MAG: hypothetical protein OHK0023_06380 [Anaerolineae bacterium]